MKHFWVSMGLAALYAGGYALLMLLVSFLTGAAFSLWHMLSGSAASPAALQAAYSHWLASAYPFVNLGINALAALCIRGIRALHRGERGAALGFYPMPVPMWLHCLALGAASAGAVMLLMGFLPESWLADYAEQSAVLEQGPLLARLLTIAVTAPFVEEMLFRGLIYGTLRRGMARPLAIVLCALSFGAMHGQPVWIAYAVLLGLMLCLVRDACGSLWGPICFHISFNMVGSFLLPQWRMQGMQAFGVLSLSLAACFFLSGSLGLGGERKAP